MWNRSTGDCAISVGKLYSPVVLIVRGLHNEERPKKSMGGLTPAQYAKQLAIQAIAMPENSKSTCY
jgi:hypothetical protein